MQSDASSQKRFPVHDGANILSGEVLSAEERELVREIVRAMRSIRFGSIALTIHEGNLVEIQKTEKIRRRNPA